MICVTGVLCVVQQLFYTLCNRCAVRSCDRCVMRCVTGVQCDGDSRRATEDRSPESAIPDERQSVGGI